jgi:hypothetical protein
VFDDAAHRWKQPNKDEPGARNQGTGVSKDTPLSDADKAAVGKHVLPGLDAKIQSADPEAAAKPGVLKWAQDKALTGMAKVGLFLVKNEKLFATAGGILSAVLDTPQDMMKFGYNPSVSSGGHASSIHDPMRDQLGISTHLAATIATHVLSAGLKWFKGKLGNQPASESAPGNLADAMAELLGILAHEFGLPMPDKAAIAKALGVT